MTSIFVGLGAGGRSDLTFPDGRARRVVGPSLIDVGVLAVGSVTEGMLEVDHVDGPDGTIRTVSVVNLLGAAFAYEGPAAGSVVHGARVEVPSTFAPTEAGACNARVTIVHDRLDAPVDIDVRGHAVTGAATLSPLGLDLGRVSPGSDAVRDVLLTGTGIVELALSEVAVSNPVFSLRGSVDPAPVLPGDARPLSIRFAPADDLPATARVTVGVPGTTLPEVAVRGNGCARGVPGVYDLDGDGVTSCAGDCDEDQADVRPGAEEAVSADGIDQDCDGLVDEGTSAFDDDGDGLSEDEGDCNDVLGGGAPGRPGVLGNGIDDDGDPVVDAGSTDADPDGYDPTIECDCADGDASVHPAAPSQSSSTPSAVSGAPGCTPSSPSALSPGLAPSVPSASDSHQPSPSSCAHSVPSSIAPSQSSSTPSQVSSAPGRAAGSRSSQSQAAAVYPSRSRFAAPSSVTPSPSSSTPWAGTSAGPGATVGSPSLQSPSSSESPSPSPSAHSVSSSVTPSQSWSTPSHANGSRWSGAAPASAPSQSPPRSVQPTRSSSYRSVVSSTALSQS